MTQHSKDRNDGNSELERSIGKKIIANNGEWQGWREYLGTVRLVRTGNKSKEVVI